MDTREALPSLWDELVKDAAFPTWFGWLRSAVTELFDVLDDQRVSAYPSRPSWVTLAFPGASQSARTETK